jgi:hypothetical protein
MNTKERKHKPEDAAPICEVSPARHAYPLIYFPLKGVARLEFETLTTIMFLPPTRLTANVRPLQGGVKRKERGWDGSREVLER